MATMNISLSDDLKEFVEEEVRSGAYSTASEYLRQLIREKREESRFHEKILEGLASPVSNVKHDELISSLRKIASGD